MKTVAGGGGATLRRGRMGTLDLDSRSRAPEGMRGNDEKRWTLDPDSRFRGNGKEGGNDDGDTGRRPPSGDPPSRKQTPRHRRPHNSGESPVIPADAFPRRRRHRGGIPPLALSLALSLPAAGGGPAAAGGVGLLEIYELAHDSDPQFRQAVAARQEAGERRPQARALLLPEVSLRADALRNEQDIERGGFGDVGKFSFSSRSYRLSLTQPVLRVERLFGLRQAGSRVAQAEAELEAARQALVIRVAAAYFDALAAEDSLRFAAAERKSLARRLEQVKQRFEVGLTAITDMQEAQAGFDRAVAEALTAQNDLDNAREALREISGAYFSVLAGLGAEMPLLRPQPDDIEAWNEAAMTGNLSVLAARHAVDAARGEVRRRLADRLPTVDLVASHGFDKSGGRFGASEGSDSAVGLELQVPVFRGGLAGSRAREARHGLERRLQALEQARRQAQRDTRQAFLGVLSAISRVQALKQAALSSETALQATEAGFQVGTRAAVDVVAAERDASRARRDLARARYDYLLNSMRLKQASGTLSVADLRHIDGWLE